MSSKNLVVIKNLERMIEDAGYENQTDFYRKTHPGVSQELIRKAVNGVGVQPFSAFMILAALGKNKQDIRSILEKSGDKFLYKYIGEDGYETHQLMPLIFAVERITKAAPDLTEHISSFFKLVGRAAGINVYQEIKEALDTYLGR